MLRTARPQPAADLNPQDEPLAPFGPATLADAADESAGAVADAADPLFNQSLEKGLAVLRAFNAAHRTLTLGDLATLTGMTKGSAQRTVHTLQVLGYVGKHAQTRRFQLLPKVVEIGFNYLASHPLIRMAHPYLSQLSNASGETASLTEPIGAEMLYIAQAATSRFIPILTPVGARVPMYCTSSGRAFLSCLPDEEARDRLERADRPQRTPATLTGVDAIMARVADCRRVGFATNVEELFLGDMGVGAPIRDSRGQVLGAIHLAPPSSRWSPDEMRQKLGPLVIDCARAVSESLPHSH
jgi:DNA-binding IclR family transcriptional regulator